MVLCNLLDRPVTYPYEVHPSRHGLTTRPGATWRIEQITPQGCTVVDRHPAAIIARSERLGPREIKVLEISAEE